MPNLEKQIAEWRQTLLAAPKGFSPETVDELESHLRETVEALVRSGLSEADAFPCAVRQLGGAPMLAAEFEKLDEGTWLPLKILTGLSLVGLLALTLLLVARFETGRLSLLLATHVFFAAVGYTATFLIGALGICFVSQRCLSEPSPARQRALTRVTFRMGSLAAATTIVAVILGMVWTKAEWGRYWAWDAKETGAFMVVAWQGCFLLAHKLRLNSAGRILVLSLLGNIVVSLAWFGVNVLTSNGAMNWTFLLAGILSQLALFLLGLAPAGWLRRSKTS